MGRRGLLATGFQAMLISVLFLVCATAPGEIPMMRLKARLKAATDW